MSALEFTTAARSIASARGFPRGDHARAELIAECAMLLEAQCATPDQADHAASDFLRTGARFSIPEFSRFLGEWTAKQRGQHGLAELGAAWREKTDPQRRLVPEEATFYGFTIPGWVRPHSASDQQIGENILRFSAEIDRRIEAEIKALTPARRLALEQRAEATEEPPPGISAKNREKNPARIHAQMVFDLRTMHYFRVRDGGKPDLHMGSTFEKYLPVCCGRVQY